MTRDGRPFHYASAVEHWGLDPSVNILNHGSYGATPKRVLEFQSDLRRRLEAQPLLFFGRDHEGLLDQARAKLAAFIGAPANDIAFVQNATTGVNTVLRSLTFAPGDEILTTNHAYNACQNALDFVAARSGSTVRVVNVPFPLKSPSEVTQAILEETTESTKLALIDHVTSFTGLVFPVKDIVRELKKRGVDTLIDGAHAPGMLPLNVLDIAPTYYTGNCHKWICTPKGVAVLYVHPSKQDAVHPLTISHGANSKRTDRSRFRLEFDWCGTYDPSAYLSLPKAVDVMSEIGGGWGKIYEHNHALALEMRKVLCSAFEQEVPAPPDMIGTLATVPLGRGPEDPSAPNWAPTLHDTLWDKHRIEVPVFHFPAPRARYLRVSAQLYNHISQAEHLATTLRPLL